MLKRVTGGLCALALAGILLVATLAAADQAVPKLQSPVTDITGTLSSEEIRTLESALFSFSQEKGSQLAILIVATTEPETIEQYGLRVAEQWKLGRNGVDDGILFLIAKNDKALRIEVGYGLEGALSDVVSKRIIDEIVVPQFRAGMFFQGISDGAYAIIKVVSGEPLPSPKSNSSSMPSDLLFLIVIVGVALNTLFQTFTTQTKGSLLAAVLAGVAGLIIVSAIGALIAAAFVFLLSIAQGNGGSSRYGGWSSGGSSRGGFGGGGFSGGGGSFGGGGASGRW